MEIIISWLRNFSDGAQEQLWQNDFPNITNWCLNLNHSTHDNHYTKAAPYKKNY